jgi:general secretion pathway protein C
MASRWLAFVVWALVGGTAVTWLLGMLAVPAAVPAHAVAVDTTPSLRSDLTRLMGADPVEPVQFAATPASDSRFKLLGVVAATGGAAASKALALIAVDGKPARAYRVGAAVDGDLVLQTVHARGVELGPGGGGAAVKLDLALLAAAATGTLPLPGSRPGAMPGAVPGTLPGTLPITPPAPAPAGDPSAPPSATQEPVPQPVAPGARIPPSARE